MKRGTPRHPKLIAFAAKLDVPIFAAVGLLEMLWHFTAEFCHAGDIGRFPDEAIAKAIGWEKTSTKLASSQHEASTMLVSCLVETGWLDRCQCHRLRVHDWPAHADQTVSRILVKRNQGFLQCYDDPSTKLASNYDETSQPKAYSLEPKPIANTISLEPDGFSVFWNAYPRKVSKTNALKAWKRAELPDLQVILAAIAVQSKTKQWQTPEYIPHPATWINGRKWEDEISAAAPSVNLLGFPANGKMTL